MTKKLKKEVVKQSADVAENDGIVVGDPQLLRPQELPLVVKLPADASKAQVEYGRLLNSYAYQNPEKFAVKKDVMIAKLRSLKNAPDPVENQNLKITKKLTA